MTFAADEVVSEAGFATDISAGPDDEAEQVLDFTVTPTGDDIFEVAPAIDPATGDLSFTLNQTTGTAILNIVLTDDGGTDNGGADTSPVQTLTVNNVVPAVNTSFEAVNADGDINDGLVFAVVGADFNQTLADDILDLGTEAVFDNLLGLYEVLDPLTGAIDDGFGGVILPGEAGYAEAAIANRVPDFLIQGGSSGDSDLNTTAAEFGDVLLEAGRFFAPFLIANAGELGFDGFIAAENAEDDGEFNDAADFAEDQVAYFSYGAANPDGVEHVRSLGNDTFGFEDLPGNLPGVSDNDFNDIVVQFEFV